MKCVFCDSTNGIAINRRSNNKSRKGICINCLKGIFRIKSELNKKILNTRMYIQKNIKIIEEKDTLNILDEVSD